MVRPNQEGQDRDSEQGTNHRHVTEDRLAGVDGQYFRNKTHGREGDDINFGVTEEPEQVLVKNGATAFIGKGFIGRCKKDLGEIEARSAMTVKQQQNETR